MSAVTWEMSVNIPQARSKERDVKEMPKTWSHHLLRVYPYAARGQAEAQISHVKAYAQLHQTERNGGGYVNLWSGRPDFNPAFERGLEKAARDLRAERGLSDEYRPASDPVRLVPTVVIDQAVQHAARLRPDLFLPPAAPHWKLPGGTPALPSVFEYYCTLRDLRSWTEDGFASLLGVETKRVLYGLKSKAVLAVWVALPEEHRLRAWGDIP